MPASPGQKGRAARSSSTSSSRRARERERLEAAKSASGRLPSHKRTIVLVLVFLALVAAAGMRWLAPVLRERSLRDMPVDQLQQMTQSQPDNERAFYYLGVKLRDGGQLADAEGAFQKAAQVNPDDEQAWLAWAGAEESLGDSKGEFATLSKFAQAHADSADVHMALARFYTSHEAFDEAYDEANMAAKLAPQDEDAWLLLGGRAMDLSLEPKAEAAFRQAVKIAPNDWHGLLNLALVLQTEKQSQEALVYYRKAYAIAPNEPGPMLALGGMLLTTGSSAADQQQAMQLLQRSVSMNPDSPPGLRLLGQAYLQAGQYQEARQTLERAAKLSPEDATVHFHLQQAYMRLGDTALAASEAKKHKEIASYLVARERLQDQLYVTPNDLAVGLKYARICAAHEDYLDAVLEYQRLLTVHPEATAVRTELAQVEKKLRQAAASQ